jgi:iduronate 2-sulfatase
MQHHPTRLRCLLLSILLSVPLLPKPLGAAERPNILLICVDDLKPMAGCYGDTRVQTPHIDRLAARGVRFDAAYCNQAVCAPSRNALLTGLRPQSLGIYDLGTHFRKTRPDAVTLPRYFRDHGWRTASLGKVFHVGHGNRDDEASWSVPSVKGEVVAYASVAGDTREAALFGNRSAKGLPRGPAWEAADVADDAYPDGQLAREAVRRLQASATTPDGPWFLALGFVKPHLPFCAPKRYWDLYRSVDFQPPSVTRPPIGAPGYAPTAWSELRNYEPIPHAGPVAEETARTLIHGYHAAVSYVDAQIGLVLDTLADTGLERSTVVVLWGDHGWHLGDHGMWCKHSTYEQAARIPLLIAGPGIPPGTVTSAPIETVDLYPTLAALGGLPAPRGLDGLDHLAVLQGGAAIRDHVIHVFPRGERLGRAIRTARHRLVEWKKPGDPGAAAELELYDYQADPLEQRNLALEQPEVVAGLRAILARHPEALPQGRMK